MKKGFILLSSVLLLSACVSPPQGLEKEQSSLRNIKDIVAEDYACRCKTVRLGGKVLSATAMKDRMRVEILSLPIASFSAKPVLSADSDGRFIAYLDGFIEPENLIQQYITVSGILKGTETEKIDRADYTYPVVQVKNYKKWRLAQRYAYAAEDWEDFDGYYASPFWGWPSPFWYPRPMLRYYLY
ncbi:outer membrane lipoprotein [Mesocricetibacter intestinalis]|uniref:Outer membrane lipoprotein n=1 Tax=Mesocricetibacter intestinalis TaxID=1521930 RepID=A0A4R6VAP1_9PAST|nr:Slp family lipoprotein [Mesocricetibacter intestinalis]TDQ57334.1 outer membrane lipoprotein [Mesocricetibacter intestinalis]